MRWPLYRGWMTGQSRDRIYIVVSFLTGRIGSVTNNGIGICAYTSYWHVITQRVFNLSSANRQTRTECRGRLAFSHRLARFSPAPQKRMPSTNLSHMCREWRSIARILDGKMRNGNANRSRYHERTLLNLADSAELRSAYILLNLPRVHVLCASRKQILYAFENTNRPNVWNSSLPTITSNIN